MKNKKNILYVLLLVFACSTGDKPLTGTLTETDTSAMVGVVYDADKDPVYFALVRLHYQNNDQGVYMGIVPESSRIRTGSTTTDQNGFFLFDSVDTGRFFVEVKAGDSLGALSEVTVTPYDSLVSTTAYLKKYGRISGTIDASAAAGGNADIYMPEVDRTVRVQTDGTFEISDLPVWDSYSLVLMMSDSAVESEFDDMNVRVAEDSTTIIIKAIQNIVQND
jgi:hypothetical protein